MEDMEKFEQTLKEIEIKEFTPERLEQLSKKAYSEDRQYPENFSNWYTHIKDFGYFSHANIISNQIFTWEETEIIMQEINNINKVQ